MGPPVSGELCLGAIGGAGTGQEEGVFKSWSEDHCNGPGR